MIRDAGAISGASLLDLGVIVFGEVENGESWREILFTLTASWLFLRSIFSAIVCLTNLSLRLEFVAFLNMEIANVQNFLLQDLIRLSSMIQH